MKTQNNLNIDISGKAGKYNITLKDSIFTQDTVFKLNTKIERLKKIGSIKKISIKINSDRINDDACMLAFENCLYYWITEDKIKLTFKFKGLKVGILQYDLFANSLFARCFNKKLEFDNEIFVEKYTQLNDIKSNYLRKYIPNNIEFTKKNFPSLVLMEIFTFAQTLGYDKTYAKNIGLVVSEILDNVLSHTNSDAVLSVKSTDIYNKEGNESKAISVSLMNISNTLIYSNIKEQFENNTLIEPTKTIIEKSYKNNMNKFNKYFDQDAFYFISAFQKNVTTRINSVGGTGLTILVKNLIEASYDDFCYVISGNNLLVFEKEYLKLNEDGTIGFNKTNSYYNDIPDPMVFRRLNYEFNGTLFNLMFIY